MNTHQPYTYESYECAYKNSLVKFKKKGFSLLDGNYVCEMECILKDYNMNDTYIIDIGEEDFYNALDIIIEKKEKQFNKFNSLVDIMICHMHGFEFELREKMKKYIENLSKDED